MSKIRLANKNYLVQLSGFLLLLTVYSAANENIENSTRLGNLNITNINVLNNFSNISTNWSAAGPVEYSIVPAESIYIASTTGDAATNFKKSDNEDKTEKQIQAHDDGNRHIPVKTKTKGQPKGSIGGLVFLIVIFVVFVGLFLLIILRLRGRRNVVNTNQSQSQPVIQQEQPQTIQDDPPPPYPGF